MQCRSQGCYRYLRHPGFDNKSIKRIARVHKQLAEQQACANAALERLDRMVN